MVAVSFGDPPAIAFTQFGAVLREIPAVDPVIDEQPLNRLGDISPRDVASRFSSLQEGADEENEGIDLQKISLIPS